MKKNLIALAILGAFSGAALAQSNVTLYGILDVNYQYIDPDGNNSSISGINSGHQSGNRWGIRGSEALSPNLNAVFTLESGFSLDTGMLGQGSRLFGRQAFLGLSGGWGTVVGGRLATFSSGTGSFDMIGAVDPFGTGFGDSSLGSTFTSIGFVSGAGLRLDNAALYQSPDWGGFKFGAGYSFNGNGTELAGSGNNVRTWFLGASFGRGPFYVGVTYDSISPPDGGVAGSAATPAIAPNAADQKMLQIGATWDFKIVKLYGAWAMQDDQWFISSVGVSPVAGEDADAWMFGASAPLFGGLLMASYQKRDGDIANVCLGVFTPAGPCSVALTPREEEMKVWSIAYSYPLSRRTNLYANFSDRDGEKFLNNNPNVDRKMYTAGIRHLF